MQRGTFPSTVTVLFQFIYIRQAGCTLQGHRGPSHARPSSSHLHFLQHLKSFNFSNAIMIQINILKQRQNLAQLQTSTWSVLPGLGATWRPRGGGAQGAVPPEAAGTGDVGTACCDRQRPDVRRTLHTRSLVASLQGSPALACSSSGFPESRMAGPLPGRNNHLTHVTQQSRCCLCHTILRV